MTDVIDALRTLSEFQRVTAELGSGTARNLESLLKRRTDLLRDLIFYRHYGFQVRQLEDLVTVDPNIQAMAQQIAAEEESSNALTAFQDKTGSRSVGDESGAVDPAGPDSGFHYQGFRGRRRS